LAWALTEVVKSASAPGRASGGAGGRPPCEAVRYAAGRRVATARVRAASRPGRRRPVRHPRRQAHKDEEIWLARLRAAAGVWMVRRRA